MNVQQLTRLGAKVNIANVINSFMSAIACKICEFTVDNRVKKKKIELEF